MSPEELSSIQRDLIIIEQKLVRVEKDLAEHKGDFKVFKDSDFKTFKDNDFKEFAKQMLEEREGYFAVFLSKEAFKQWCDNAFSPIQKIVWGVVILIGGGVIGAGLTFLLRKS